MSVLGPFERARQMPACLPYVPVDCDESHPVQHRLHVLLFGIAIHVAPGHHLVLVRLCSEPGSERLGIMRGAQTSVARENEDIPVWYVQYGRATAVDAMRVAHAHDAHVCACLALHVIRLDVPRNCSSWAQLAAACYASFRSLLLFLALVCPPKKSNKHA